MSRWLLVELDEDLAAHLTTPNGVFASIKVVSGVVRVVDLSAISRETLDVWFPPSVPKKGRNGRTAS
jgi:hypothetical protein